VAIDEEQIAKIAYDIICGNRYLCLATSDNNLTWASPLFYAIDQHCDFYCISRPASRHALNAASNDNVSWAIYTSHLEPEQVDGVQFAGKWEELASEGDVAHALEVIFVKRFPDPNERKKYYREPLEFIGNSVPRKLYRLRPTQCSKFDPSSPGGDERLPFSLEALQKAAQLMNM
jgi:uncharacterized protein YhbP (UPF0306 family)